MSPDAGGLPRYFVKALILAAFVLRNTKLWWRFCAISLCLNTGGDTMSGDLLGPIMFVFVFALIFSGYPVAFSLGGTALIFAAIGVVNGYFDWGLMLLFSQRLFGIMNNCASRCAVFHTDRRHSRKVQAGRRPDHHWAHVWPCSRWACLGCRDGGHFACCRHRCGRRLCHSNGGHLDACDAQT